MGALPDDPLLMSKLTRYITSIAFGLTLLLAATPALAQSVPLTATQIQSIITTLNSFGTDQFIVANVQATLNGQSITGPFLPALSLLSPNGGEQWAQNSTQLVRWSTSNVPSTAGISIGARGFGTFNVIGEDGKQHTISQQDFSLASSLNTGSASVRMNLQPGVYELFAKTNVNDIIVNDFSNTTFTVTAPVTPLAISTITPTGGPVGTKIQISGSGFTSNNTVAFIAFTGREDYSGNSPFDGWIEFPNISSPDGRTLSFTIPAKIPNGVNIQGSSQTLVIPGIYYIKVRTQKGDLSAASAFRVTSTNISSSPYDYTGAIVGSGPDGRVNGFDVTFLSRVPATYACPAGKVCDVDGLNGVNIDDVRALAKMVQDGTVSLGNGGSSQTASALDAFGGSTADDTSAPAIQPGFHYVWTHDLQIGSPYTTDIATLQGVLRAEGLYSGDITGGFYAQTFAAVKAFQQKYGIEATGYVGSQTRAQLNALYN